MGSCKNGKMRAEIVSIGTELLLGQIVDTNAAHLAEEFASIGLSCTHRQTVGDNLGRLVAALQLALDRADLVVAIGGLGPTQDDLTRHALAEVSGQTLVLDSRLEAELRLLFASRNLAWVDSQLSQAMRPVESESLPNPNGTAPGLWIPVGSEKVLIALPGPPRECLPMWTEQVVPRLAVRLGKGVIHSVTVRTCGIGEAVLAEKIVDLLEGVDPTVAPYAKPAEVHLRITTAAASPAVAQEKIEPVLNQLRERVGEFIYEIGTRTLQEVLIDELRDRRQTLSVAESCTGGGLGARLTQVPGSSDVLMGGVITYTNRLKTQLLGVSESILDSVGAVSPECAEAMAVGAKDRLQTDWALSITGIAGPGGATPEKPVGLVYVGLAGPKGCQVRECRFRGSREQVRERSTQAALVLLREALQSD